ncbi:MAG TPA: ABC transporter permease subunit [Bryobacteraceae bacterium]|jgi:ABC-type transport system involved in multi-copper enzyme maturation permease subunit
MRAQIASVLRLELRKTFFSRRGLWIYVLAFAPALLYLIHAIDVTRDHEHRQALAAAHPVATEALSSIKQGMSVEQLFSAAGEPYSSRTITQGRRARGGGFRDLAIYQYTDGDSDFTFVVVDGQIERINEQDRCNLQKDSAIFATVFQFFYLRLAVFFGCVGIFMNLIRGEMLDKSLHFYLLAPMRREGLLVGKYLAGLIASVSIFVVGTLLQIAALSWHFDPGAVSAYLHGPGWGQIASYVGVTALACAGYGSIFLAAGLLFRNPILPAAFVLLWESINLFLPAALKKISVIFYLQALCPVVASPDRDLSLFQRLLISSAEPPRAWVAVTGLLVVTAGVLVFSGFRARRLEINYGTE